jgi:N-hydroxyarylamine O-acetyltransferase
MLLLVQLGTRSWIADVGFGGPGLRAPLPFEPDRIAEQDGHRFRLVDAGPFGTMLQTQRGDAWQDLYSFDLAHVIPADIAYGNHYTSTHPDSLFTTARVAALPRPDGRIALLDQSLSISTGGTDSRQMLGDDAGYLVALREHFGIDLDAPYAALRPLRDPG